MCQVLESQGRQYAIEWPTRETYAFTGSLSMSARTDLVVLEASQPTLAVEFKAGQPRQTEVDKDMEKLVRERVPALWFHTLANANAGTLPALFSKLKLGLAHAAGDADSNQLADPPGLPTYDHRLTAAVAVLQGKHVGLWTQTVGAGEELKEDPGAWRRDAL